MCPEAGVVVALSLPRESSTLRRACPTRLSARCVRGNHLDYQLSDPTRLLVEREVTRVGDRDDDHVRALLEPRRSSSASPTSSRSPNTTHARAPVSHRRETSEPWRSRYSR